MNLLKQLQQQLKQHGPIPFVEFMHHVLYMPNLGYYSAGLPKFGKEGDFITAPELTPLFGQTLANQCAQVLSECKVPCLFEFGAGSGQLCIDLLTQLENLDCLPDDYYILEVSGDLAARQKNLIQSQIPHLASRISWLSRWPDRPFEGVVIANEVLDAMPVQRFLQTATEVLESYVSLDAQEQCVEVFQPCTNQRLLDHVKTVLPEDVCPYLSEANLFVDDWLQQCYTMLDKGAVFILDYGFPRHEYYHPDRHQGTLMCHYRHQAHTNPFIHLGEQDITAHVDFTHVADAACAAGFHVAGYTNQASFLLANGLLSLLSALIENHPEDVRLCAHSRQTVKKLLQPNEMGELFKVIALTKQFDIPLNGFQLHDKRVSL